MITSPRRMLTCHWAARRLQLYLDSDPSALLDAAEVHRLAEHLAACAHCSGRVEQYRALGQALHERSVRHRPDPELVARMYEQAERLITQGPA